MFRMIAEALDTFKAFAVVVGFLTIVGFSAFYVITTLPAFLSYLMR